MQTSTNRNRDAYAFSLGGLKAKSGYGPVAAMADTTINAAIERRLRQPTPLSHDRIIAFEDFLARYFAAGLLRSA